MLLRRLVCGDWLEVEPQSELHAARNCEHAGRHAKLAARQTGVDKSRIEADGVEDVVDLPGELESSEFTNLPVLCEPGVDVEEAVAAEVVALTGFTRIRKPHRRAGIYA